MSEHIPVPRRSANIPVPQNFNADSFEIQDGIRKLKFDIAKVKNSSTLFLPGTNSYAIACGNHNLCTLNDLPNGSANTTYGHRSGRDIVNGSKNTIFGSDALAGSADAKNRIVLNGVGKYDNTFHIGDTITGFHFPKLDSYVSQNVLYFNIQTGKISQGPLVLHSMLDNGDPQKPSLYFKNSPKTGLFSMPGVLGFTNQGEYLRLSGGQILASQTLASQTLTSQANHSHLGNIQPNNIQPNINSSINPSVALPIYSFKEFPTVGLSASKDQLYLHGSVTAKTLQLETLTVGKFNISDNKIETKSNAIEFTDDYVSTKKIKLTTHLISDEKDFLITTNKVKFRISDKTYVESLGFTNSSASIQFVNDELLLINPINDLLVRFGNSITFNKPVNLQQILFSPSSSISYSADLVLTNTNSKLFLTPSNIVSNRPILGDGFPSFGFVKSPKSGLFFDNALQFIYDNKKVMEINENSLKTDQIETTIIHTDRLACQSINDIIQFNNNRVIIDILNTNMIHIAGFSITSYGDELNFMTNNKAIFKLKENLILNTPILLIDGTSASPSIGFKSNPTIGIYTKNDLMTFSNQGDILHISKNSINAQVTIYSPDGQENKPGFAFNNNFGMYTNGNCLSFATTKRVLSLSDTLSQFTTSVEFPEIYLKSIKLFTDGNQFAIFNTRITPSGILTDEIRTNSLSNGQAKIVFDTDKILIDKLNINEIFTKQIKLDSILLKDASIDYNGGLNFLVNNTICAKFGSINHFGQSEFDFINTKALSLNNVRFVTKDNALSVELNDKKILEVDENNLKVNQLQISFVESKQIKSLEINSESINTDNFASKEPITNYLSSYSEYFDGDYDDRFVGETVVLSAGKARISTIKDHPSTIFGVVRSKTASGITNNLATNNTQKYQLDNLGRYVLDDNKQPIKNQSKPIDKSKSNSYVLIGLLGQMPIKKSAIKNPNWIRISSLDDQVDLYLIR